LIRINPKHTLITMAFIMSLIMSVVISLGVNIIHTGFSLETLRAFPISWLQGWLIAFPVAYLVLPRVQKLFAKLTR
jgi:Protein of unknown function (DUF2798)